MEIIADEARIASREIRFEELYEASFPLVAAWVKQLKGSFQDAKDIFQDSLVIYMEKSEDPSFTIGCPVERYILGISKHLWLRKFKEDRKRISLDTLDTSIIIPADYFPTINESRLLHFLEVTGKKCLDLLHAFYYEPMPMKDMANRFGYKTEHSATVQKFKCLEKIRNVVKEKAIVYEDFYE